MEKQKKKRTARTVTIVLLVLLIAFSIFQIIRILALHADHVYIGQTPVKTIVRDGVSYFPRQDITVVMLMGIDEYEPVKVSASYENHGDADLVALLIFDETNEVCRILQLNRDIMVKMPALGVGGWEAGTYYGQLALAHTFGTGLEDSCENVRKTVSDLLHGINIDHYVSINMGAVPILNDAVGGVTVNVVDDFSQIDSTIHKGQVTLNGQQAANFVSLRKDVEDQLNLSRIERQNEYILGFRDAWQDAVGNDSEYIAQVYEAVEPYLVTDCSTTVITDMMECYSSYEIVEIVSPEGENVKGEEFYEFYVDETQLDKLILRLFYAAKE